MGNTWKFNLRIPFFCWSAAIIGLSLTLSCSDSDKWILPEKMDITEAVYASVIIQPDSLYQAYAAVAGILEKNLVEEGDLVKKGDPIVQIINTTPRLNMENARLNLELAKDNFSGNNALIKELQDQIRAARLKLRIDSINYFRQKNLWEKKIGSQAEFENRELAYELSRNNLNLLERNLNRTRTELQTKVIQAKNTYRAAVTSTRDFTVTSKLDGTVYALYKNPGELITTLTPVAAVGCSDIYVIEMLVDEVDIVRLKIGQDVFLTLDSYQDEVWNAQIFKIYPRKDDRSQTFKVEARFSDPPEVLYPGLAGEANIIIEEKKNALTIPRSYLSGPGQVRTSTGLIEVTTGLESMDRIEITSGIDEGTYILKPEE